MAGIVQPLEGRGNFHSYFDVINRWQSEDHLDVLVLVEVTNADINYAQIGDSFIGKLNFEVTLEGPEGQVITQKRHMNTPKLDRILAASRTTFQVFGLVLKDVPFREGRLTCRLKDALKEKRGILENSLMVSESVVQWSAENELRGEGGVTVGDPLFLAHAPMDTWDPSENPQGSGAQFLYDYMHPSRRYGLEEEKLQLFIPVWPSVGKGVKPKEHEGLRIQIISEDMVYSITDTLQFDDRGIVALENGRPAGTFYELDLNILPEGSYRLAIAPLNRAGKGQLAMFDVVWKLSTLGQNRDQVLGEGRLVFSGRDLQTFLAENPAGQSRMLDHFWNTLNPDPENPVNPVYIEFLDRVTYVRNFYGGFGPEGATDPRGEVYLLLGPPDDIEQNSMPMNSAALGDAQIKTFQQFAPDREGTWAKTEDITQRDAGRNDQSVDIGGIPMPESRSGDAKNLNNLYSSYRQNGFQLWKYDTGGNPLFDNYLTEKGMWQRFLFVDRSGAGDFFLESSNSLEIND